MRTMRVLLLCAAAAMAAAAGTLAYAQSAAAFEVATIKLSDAPPNAGALLNSPGPGRLGVTNFTLRMLIGAAFGPELGPGYQVAGGPDWMNQERYVILGQTVAGTTRDAMMGMLKTLLIERFALKTHTEQREVDAYALVPARGDGRLGPKLTKWDGTCNGKEPPPAAPNTTGPRCAAFFRPPGMFMRGVSMAVFANMLSAQITNLGRPVLDRTGLSGEYDFDLEVTFAPPNPNAAAPDATAPSVFVAVQEQLGLKLEPTRTKVNVLVIDNAQHPSEN